MKTTLLYKVTAFVISLCIAIGIGFICVELLGTYGWTLFLTTSFILGFVPPYLIGRKETLTAWTSLGYGLSTIMLGCICLLVFAIEGFLCIAMAMPILFAVAAVGSLLAFGLTKKKSPGNGSAAAALLLLSVATAGFDQINEESLVTSTTTVIINAPIEKVWDNVVAVDEIPAPTDWVLRTGIAYPIKTRIDGRGVGAVRHCNFSTGSFVEPVTTWQPPYLLQFRIDSQPAPLEEWNPFWKIHPPHLDGYFVTQRGQFKLSRLSATQTKLESTTWYRMKIYPENYWHLWSDFIIHRVHGRVLSHIKARCEA